jgi:8-oxo-dGTP diphosphatase
MVIYERHAIFDSSQINFNRLRPATEIRDYLVRPGNNPTTKVTIFGGVSPFCSQLSIQSMANFDVSLKARLLLQKAGDILLLKQTKPNGGNYSLVGGTIEQEEFAVETLIRESWEEAGIKLSPDDIELVHVLHKRSSKEHRIVLYFRAYNFDGHPKSREKNKFENVEWWPLKELPRNLTATVRHVLKSYNSGIMYSELKKK